MKRKMYLCVLAACVALSTTACSNKKADTPVISTETKKENVTNKTSEETVATEETEENETEATETEISETEETAVTETETTEGTETETTTEEADPDTEAAFTVTDIAAKVMYAKQPLNTRKGPGLTYDKVSVLKKHEAVTVNGLVESENWYRLDNGSFVSGKYLLDSLPTQTVVKNETTTTQPSANTSTESKKEETTNTTTPTETKKEETSNTTPSETVTPSEPTTTPSTPEVTPSEPATPSEPTQPSTPETPSEPAVTPSEPEVKVCEHKNMVQTGWVNGTDLTAHCGYARDGEFRCADCGGNYTIKEVPATGNHDWNVTVNQEADCAYEGWETWICKNCGKWEDHTYPTIPDKHDGYEVEEYEGHKYCSGCCQRID